MDKKTYNIVIHQMLAEDGPKGWRIANDMKDLASRCGVDPHELPMLLQVPLRRGELNDSWLADFRKSFSELPRHVLQGMVRKKEYRELLDAAGFDYSEFSLNRVTINK